MPYILGIDLGTTNSAMAILRGGHPEILTNAEGDRTTPSVVGITKDGERVVGKPAKRQAVLRPDHTVASIKRHMGEDMTVELDGRSYTPPEVSAMILRKLKRDAEERLGEPVEKAVITCPAYFTDAQRQHTKDAGKIAGLEVMRIINEPTAAALAYGYKDADERTIVVFDLGGGTFDVSVLETGDGVFEVLATSGNNHLGGDDFDQVLVQHYLEHLRKSEDIDLSEDRQALQRLREAAENTKIELSSKKRSHVNIPFLTQSPDGEPVHLDIEVTRAQYEGLAENLLLKLEGPTKRALADSKIDTADIDAVIMVGGMTRMPAVQAMAERITGVKPDLSVNPDEAVALGAAIQAGVISGDVEDLVLLDVTPLTLGIETLGGRFTPLVERNTTIPTTKSKVFTTAADGQTSVDVHVLQGERPMAGDNKTLGRFHLEGIPPAPRGTPQIEVEFDIDVNGIVHVSARDQGTGKEQRISITDATRLEDNEIERMRQEAEAHEEEDQAKAERIDAQNEADAALHNARKLLEESEDVPSELAANVENAIADVEEAITNKVDAAALRAKTDALQKAVMEVGAHVYQKAAADAEQPDATAGDAAAGERPHVDPSRVKTKEGEGEHGVDVEYEEPEDE